MDITSFSYHYFFKLIYLSLNNIFPHATICRFCELTGVNIPWNLIESQNSKALKTILDEKKISESTFWTCLAQIMGTLFMKGFYFWIFVYSANDKLFFLRRPTNIVEINLYLMNGQFSIHYLVSPLFKPFTCLCHCFQN